MNVLHTAANVHVCYMYMIKSFDLSCFLLTGNEAKIQRAKYWNHWFLLDDNTCNTKLAKRIANL